MRRAMTSLVAFGIGAAAYSLSDRKTKKKFDSLIAPLTDKKTWKQLQKTTMNIIKA
ncbi:DUF3918 family protein [Alkalihalobacillus oceani]|uniref:DUF3918 family protein n=1 Tax=Halalkalibacter oceani TaxID=1653776 RepID=UPI00203F1816|nr:DUF3918 family protein [Halalkalibacter oceani]MCM3762308.1 DUF3918 family protein [Halalkalibacter oceani]